MPGFNFKYQAVLDHRRHVEDGRQRELAQVLRQRMILMSQLQQMQQTIVESRQSLADGLVGAVDLQRISQFARYSGESRARAHGIVRKLSLLERDVDDARQQLIAASRDRKAMELLHDRHRDDWRKRQDRRETEMLDEYGSQAHMRRMAEEVR